MIKTLALALFFSISLSLQAKTTGMEGVGEVSVLGRVEAQAVFAAMKALPLNFDYTKDGCYSRAHLMAVHLGKRGIKVGKLFIEAVGRNEGPFQVQTRFGLAEWTYHVAIFVLVGNEESIAMIDPTLFNGPVTMDQWMDRITGKGPAIATHTFFASPYAYVPGDEKSIRTKFNSEDISDAKKVQEKIRRDKAAKVPQSARARL